MKFQLDSRLVFPMFSDYENGVGPGYVIDS